MGQVQCVDILKPAAAGGKINNNGRVSNLTLNMAINSTCQLSILKLDTRDFMLRRKCTEMEYLFKNTVKYLKIHV